MRDIELAAQLRRISRHGHWLGGQNRVDGRSACARVIRQLIKRVADYSRDGHSTPPGLVRHLLVAALVEEDLHAVVEHAHTVAHV
jgi:hypothetical protein